MVDVSFLRPGSEILPRHFDRQVNKEIVLFYTGLSNLWGNREYRRNYTYLSIETAELLANSSVKLVGMDYLSVEKFGERSAPVHKKLLSNNIMVVESLNNKLSKLIGKEFTFFCLPLRIKGCDGSPARAFACEAWERW